MPFNTQQFQIKTEAPSGAFPPIQVFESWHTPLAEPVRVKIAPRLAVALVASGLFAPVLNPNTQITNLYESRWHQPWSEPVRIALRLRTGLNQFNSMHYPVLPSPSNQIQGWLLPWRDPVWPKKGLRIYLQDFYEAPVRYLPPANVTITMSPTEANNDVAEFGVDVYTTPPPPLDQTAVQVSIEEISVGDDASASIKEGES